eukprot:m.769446 g.769446  ORF g.769446 m.769446 type:complete len:76 (-) comp23235_c0_seq19:5963-6190(-)
MLCVLQRVVNWFLLDGIIGPAISCCDWRQLIHDTCLQHLCGRLMSMPVLFLPVFDRETHMGDRQFNTTALDVSTS